MPTEQLLYSSTDISIIAQIITGIIGLRGLFETLKPQHKILQTILGFEMLVQFIELIFYIFILRSLSINYMASARYFDWIITTPTMLITTIAYFKYEQNIELLKNSKNSEEQNNTKNKLNNMKFIDFLIENKDNIMTIVICNFFMLLFGYLGEIGLIDMFSATIFGFIFFLMGFYVIYDKYAKFSKIGNQMFSILFVVWSLYGIANVFDPIYKNISFNTLDLISKNFFGLYLYFKILRSKNTVYFSY